MHIQGWPRNLVRPPYEHQAKCLLARLDNIRGRIDPDADGEALDTAIVAFREKGELPNDDLLLEALLAHIELEQLCAHKKGWDVAEVMAVLARVQRRDAQVSEDALRALCKLAKAGRF